MSKRSGGFKPAKNYDPRRATRQAKDRKPVRSAAPSRELPYVKPAHNVKPVKITSEKIPAQATSGVAFTDLGVGANMTRVLTELGISAPFAVQEATIPEIVAGKNVLARAKTGSGKTVAFGAGIVERIMTLQREGKLQKRTPAAKLKRGETARKQSTGTKGRAPGALILAPTRELAMQIDETVQPLARSVGLFTAQLVGGLAREPQMNALKRGIDIVIGTPGRVQDFIANGQLDLRGVQIVVVDEADHMSDLGFIEPVQAILRRIKTGFQSLLFSATLDTSVRQLVAEFMPDFIAFEVDDDTSADIKHSVFVTLREEKLEILTEIASKSSRAIFFVRTKGYAEILAEHFKVHEISAVSLHGDLSQEKRTSSLKKFETGKARVLVATDVAARGIHVDSVELVVQADVADDFKTYLHRAGRTGRAGETGSVITVIPRTAQKRTRQLLEDAEVEPEFFENVFVDNIQTVLGKLK